MSIRRAGQVATVILFSIGIVGTLVGVIYANLSSADSKAEARITQLETLSTQNLVWQQNVNDNLANISHALKIPYIVPKK